MRTTRPVVLATLGLLLAACGSAPGGDGQESTNATPQVSLSAAATPTPDELAELFLEFAHRPRDLAMEVAYSGNVTSDELDFGFEASVRDAGEDEAYEATFVIAGTTTQVRSIRVGSKVYQQSGDGPWLASDEGILTFDFRDLFASLNDITFVDFHQESAGPCWRYRADPMEMPAGLFQFAIPGATDMTITTTRYEVDVDSEGLPMSLEIDVDISFVHGDAQKSAAGEYRYAFSNVGGPVSVRPPDPSDVWETFTIEPSIYAAEGLSLSYPSHWVTVLDYGDGSPGSGSSMLMNGRQYVEIQARDVPAEEAYQFSDWYYSQVAPAATAREELTVAGRTAYMSTYEWTEDGVPQIGWLVVLPVELGTYVIDGWGPADQADELGGVFDQMLATVRLGPT
jgi:hypothetical protein